MQISAMLGNKLKYPLDAWLTGDDISEDDLYNIELIKKEYVDPEENSSFEQNLNYKCPRGTVDDSNKCSIITDINDNKHKQNSNDCHDENGRFCSDGSITPDDLDKALSKAHQYNYRDYRSNDEISLETLQEYLFTPDMKDSLEQANKKLSDIDSDMKAKGVPFYDKDDLKYRVLTHPAMTGMTDDGHIYDKTFADDGIPVYVSASPDDKMTIGLMPTKDGKFTIFEGNEEASEATQDLVNDLTGAGEKMVTVYGSHTSDVVERIKNGDIPDGIFVSPKREVAEGYFGTDREVVKFKIPLSRVAQHSEIDWQIRPEKVKQKLNYKCPRGTVDDSNKCADVQEKPKRERKSDIKINPKLSDAVLTKIGNQYDSAAMGSSHQDMRLNQMARIAGYTGKPKVVSDSELEQYAKQNNLDIMYRGVSSGDHAEQFRSGDYWAGKGLNGNGTYAAYGSEGKNLAKKYAPSPIDDQTFDDCVMKMCMTKDAKVIEYDDLLGKIGKVLDKYPNAKRFISSDEGKIATILGYDAIRLPPEDNDAYKKGSWGNMIILNRTKVMVVK